MADSTKYTPINTNTTTTFTDIKLKNIFSFRTKKTKAFVYAFISIFVAVTFFLAFNPSPNPSSPWFSNIFTSSNIAPNTTTSSNPRSQFNSIYSYFFPTNATQKSINLHPPNVIKDGSNLTAIGSVQLRNGSNPVGFEPDQRGSNQTASGFELGQNGLNQTETGTDPLQNGSNRTAIASVQLQKGSNQTVATGSDSNPTNKALPDIVPESVKSVPNNVTENKVNSTHNSQNSLPTLSGNDTGSGPSQRVEEKNVPKNVTIFGKKEGSGNEDMLVKGLVDCDLFDGEWVRDDSYPLYKPGSCALIDEQFNCFNNGRPDLGFQNYKWKPKGCTLPRLDGSKMLQLLKGKRLVFVGDSLNRNMWESLICILRNSVKDKTKVYEASGRKNFRSEPSYAFVFKDYKSTVEFFVAPFLVQEWETKDQNGTKKETLRLDLMSNSAHQYKTADVVVFNTGHWWTHDKTAKGQDYYQEGGHVYKELNVLEAFRKAMTTWGMWVDANINPAKTSVFFRGYSASHFSGGQWNSGGACDNEIEPIKNTTYLTPYPDKMVVLEKVFKGMKTKVSYLNVTRLTDFRKDGHPSIYRKQHYSPQEIKSPFHFQDCSHWCLPGVPDAWNEILYAQLLVKKYQSQKQM
ncbi:trichome birefringence-like protein [Tanacetum coccineum]|uniref:Trichome birefringence-like protein n=1 Tax=Tanacetum coccineum TaxID=301880 RepID=A0ABQ4XNB1_9ASTR